MSTACEEQAREVKRLEEEPPEKKHDYEGGDKPKIMDLIIVGP